jgi:diguanylate cyclase (GGDEF)-like protein
LYVDDEAHNLEAFSRVFFDVDFVDEVITATTPEEGIRVLAEREIAAVVTDQRMPSMTGTEFLARIIPQYPDPVRLILTGYTDVHDILAAINEGHVYYFITKPWDSEELKIILRRALDYYDTVKELKRKNRELAIAYQNLEASHHEQVRLYERIVTDDKTGVHNYHFFRIRLSEEFDRARRYGHDLSLIMIDVDDFKRINDEFGHPVGDDVLRQIARLLADGQRSVDVVARYGGEEFAVILPETALDEAQIAAERLRERVRTMRLSGPAERALPVTISCGVASYPRPDIMTAEELIQRADRVLYAAKSHGKDRVCADS